MKKIILISFLVICCLEVKAQGPTITPPSADAAALGKYGVYPTDLAHGLVNISIPLYDIKTKELEVPISLSYHASGIRVGDVSSWVGLGWVLNAGGVLTRSIRGLPDENGFAVPGFSFQTHDQLAAMTDVNALFGYLDSKASGTNDPESDLYSYNANGLSGSFLYNSNSQIIQTSFSNNKIVVNTAGSSYTVIADDGNTYTFDATESTYNENTSSGANTSFYLSKITSADKTDVISFTYTDYNSYSYTDVYSGAQLVDYGSLNGDPNYSARYVFGEQLTYINTPHTKYLSKITFSNGYVNFITAADRKDIRKIRLSKIQIYSSDNVLKRSINMDQDYFVATNPAPAVQSDPNQNIAYRMKLTGVDIQDSGSVPIQSYTFNYNTSVTMPPYWGGGGVPNPLYFYGQDLYGYYNGVTNNQSLLNVSPSTYTANLANRTVNTADAQACILTEITYPTKGSTHFFYESNTTANQTSGVIGGLRINAIDNYINNDATRVSHKVFTYSGANLSSSTYYLNLFTSCIYYQVIQDETFAYDYGVTPTYYSTSPTFPMDENTNNGAFYQYITENDVNDAGVSLGKTDYQYEYEPDTTYSTYQTMPYAIQNAPARFSMTYDAYSSCISDMGWARGPLKSTTVSKINNDGSFTVVKSIVNTYKKFNEQTNYVGTNSFRSITYPQDRTSDPNVAAVKQEFQFFDILYRGGVKKLVNSVETTDGVAKSTNYFYDNTANYYLTRTQTTKSNGEAEKIINKYPQDQVSTSGLPAGAVIALDTMIARNMLGNVVEKDQYINNVLTNTSSTNYKLWPGTNILVVPDITQLSTFNNPPVTHYCFNQYDSNGNILDLTNLGGSHTSYQWGYNGMYPIAEVKNATNAEFYFLNFEDVASSGIPGHTGNNCSMSPIIIWPLPDSRTYVISYWYLTSSGWKYSGELSYVPQQVGGNSVVYQMTGGTAYDDVRIYPQDAQMTTYTYASLVGMTSSIDAKGETTYYEYDNFQRLMNIKDKDGNVIKHMSYHYQGQ